jgi:hypothetical protein
VKFGTIISIGHHVASSLASGVGLTIGVYELDIFLEAAATPEGFIEVDFLAGEASGGKPSAGLARALKLYGAALPDLCTSYGVDVSELRHLSAIYSGEPMLEMFTVSVEDKHGRRSTDKYAGSLASLRRSTCK